MLSGSGGGGELAVLDLEDQSLAVGVKDFWD